MQITAMFNPVIEQLQYTAIGVVKCHFVVCGIITIENVH